jgi:hypothetical protein
MLSGHEADSKVDVRQWYTKSDFGSSREINTLQACFDTYAESVLDPSFKYMFSQVLPLRICLCLWLLNAPLSSHACGK